ncbi:uncharacterized protein [Parasteatoda tepidariorum]|uniref:uncharacterized protein n=1 Tax=Parasteatoda tepidariorum TaxID=114398 RepID=UPI0039BD47CB
METLCVLHWNSGGLSQAMKAELETICRDRNVDIFSLVEANVTNETLQKLKFKAYNLFCLEKSRQVASGILVGIKSTITSNFTILKQMGNTQDKTEIVKIDCWKNENHFKIYSLYSPPGNKPNFDVLNISKRTIIMGDFNAHTHLVGYRDENFAGKELESFIDTHRIELVYQGSDCPSYMHYNRTLSNPDVVLVSSDIAQWLQRDVLEDPVFGHRVILTTLQVHQNKYFKKGKKVRLSWNFKKANWLEFRNILEDKLEKDDIFKDSISLDKANQKICNLILETAHKTIPRTKSDRYRPFWNEQLGNLKKKRDQARTLAETTGTAEDIDTWRALARDLKSRINESKQSTWSDFITTIDYKEDGQKLYKFMSNLTNKYQERRKEPILFGSR